MASTQHRTEQRVGGEESSSPWRRPASSGALVAGAGFLVLMALSGELIPPVLVFGIVFLGLGVGLRATPARWLHVATVVVAVLAVVGSAPFVVSDLSHPDSIAGFGPEVLIVLGILVAAVGSVLARRGATVDPRPVVGAAIALGVLALGASAVLTVSLSDDEAEPGDVLVVADGIEYPAELRATAGTVGFLVDNQDPIHHTFAIEGIDLDQDVPGSTARRVEVDLAAGTYRFYCTVPGHESMEGTLTVR